MTTTQQLSDLHFEQMFNDFSGSEWAEMYYHEKTETEYKLWMIEEAEKAAIEAAAAPTAPMMADLVKHQDAIQATISELNTMVLNASDADLRNQLKAIAAGLVNRSGLMDGTKANYLQMLDAAAANAAFFYA